MLGSSRNGPVDRYKASSYRAYNREMPEEHNRVLTDHSADLLFCPTQAAVDNLTKEGILKGVHLVGDTMYDAILKYSEIAKQRSDVLSELDLQPKGYLLATVHRASNTDNPENLRNIFFGLASSEEQIVLPLHPRTRVAIECAGINITKMPTIRVIPPQGYLNMLMLEQSARLILTDSGGVQKEAYWMGVPCITLRKETEWVETVQAGWNLLVGTDHEKIVQAIKIDVSQLNKKTNLYGDGRAAEKCVRILEGI